MSARSIANPAGGLPTAESAGEFRTHALVLPAEAAGSRFDQALSQALPQYSRARLKTWIDSGAVQVDGRPLRGKDLLAPENAILAAQRPAIHLNGTRVDPGLEPGARVLRERLGKCLIEAQPGGLSGEGKRVLPELPRGVHCRKCSCGIRYTP